MAVSLAAIGSILAATSCCLPLLPFVMAAGLAGSSTLLSEIRPYLLVGSIVFIAYGFYQSRRETMPTPNECDCVDSIVDVCGVRFHFDCLSASHG